MEARETREKISIIGIGRLGLCAALAFERVGYDVLGVDVVESYVKKINNKTLVSSEPHVMDYLRESKHFRATLDIDEALTFSDIIFVLVATPTGVDTKSYDHSTLSHILHEINKRKVSNKHVVIGCTVLPGYIINTGRFLLRDCISTTLNYNPEFIAQGEIIHGFENPDMVLIGAETEEAGGLLEKIYHKCCQNKPKICKMSAESAEITKLSVNCFITTKIAFANTIADIAERTPGSNATDILHAIGADTRVGVKCLRPGYGFGGPCFPRDNRALGNYSGSIGVDPIIPRATDQSNKLHAKLMADIIISEVRDNQVEGDLDKYEFTDVAYKPGCAVPIIEESQKLEVACILVRNGFTVTIRDRKEIIENVMKEYGNLFEYNIDL
jgi:UDPglucose 6-dehydrogenase